MNTYVVKMQQTYHGYGVVEDKVQADSFDVDSDGWVRFYTNDEDDTARLVGAYRSEMVLGINEAVEE